MVQEPNIQEIVCRALGREVGDVTPADACSMLVELDRRPWWLATLATMLLEQVGRQRAADRTVRELAEAAVSGARELTRAVD